MANLSDVHGTYIFDFSQTKITGDAVAKLQFIQGLHHLVCQCYDGQFREYFTDFDLEVLDLGQCADEVVSVPFSACGRWWYRNNLEWYTHIDTDLYDYIKALDGLVITVDYVEMETGVAELYIGFVEIVVNDDDQTRAIHHTSGTVFMVASFINTYPLTATLAVEHGFYDSVDDYNECLFGE